VEGEEEQHSHRGGQQNRKSRNPGRISAQARRAEGRMAEVFGKTDGNPLDYYEAKGKGKKRDLCLEKCRKEKKGSSIGEGLVEKRTPLQKVGRGSCYHLIVMEKHQRKPLQSREKDRVRGGEAKDEGPPQLGKSRQAQEDPNWNGKSRKKHRPMRVKKKRD